MKNYIETPILKRHESRSWHRSTDDNGPWTWIFCASVILEYFELPKKAKRIQFRAYKEFKPGRVKVKFDGVNQHEHYAAVDGDNVEFVFYTLELIRIFRKRRKTWYVELYYWE